MQKKNIKLIAGLGNPGPKYSQTRHNVGAQFIEFIASHYFPIHWKKECQGMLSNTLDTYRLFLPSTYMNESGKAIQAIAQFYRIPYDQILLVYDDLDLSTGSIRLKYEGGHGGHNGLRNIIEYIQTSSIPRIRIGIGRPEYKHQVHTYVLTEFTPSEKNKIQHVMENIWQVWQNIIEGDFNFAMQYLHTIE